MSVTLRHSRDVLTQILNPPWLSTLASGSLSVWANEDVETWVSVCITLSHRNVGGHILLMEPLANLAAPPAA